MKILLFIPDDPALKAALPRRDEIVADPPRSLDELRRIDEECRGRVRAVFYVSKDPAWRAEMKEIYAHYHRSRRDVLFKKPGGLARALFLAGKTESLIRWNAVVPMAIFAGAVLLLLFVFRDALLQKGAVAGLQAVFRARAEMAGLTTTLSPSIELSGVAVANRREPMKNLFEFDRLSGGVSLGQLLAGRVHSDEIALEGLRFGGERKESGALPAAEPEPDPLVPEEADGFDNAVTDLVRKLEPPAADDLETVRKAREAENEARARLERIRKTAIPDSVRASLESLRADLQGLRSAKADIEAAAKISFDDEKRKVDSSKADVESVRTTLKNAEALVEKAKAIKKVTVFDIPRVKSLIDEMNATIQALETAGPKLENAAKSIDKAKAGIEGKKADAEKKLVAADGGLAEARKLGAPDLEKRFAAVSGDIAKAKEELEKIRADVDFIASLPDALHKSLEQDRDRVLSRYSLENFSADELVRAVLGEAAVTWLNRALFVHRIVGPYLAARKETGVKAKLPDGTVYLFPTPEGTPPGLWIRKVSFRGAFDDFKLEGRAANITSDLARVGEDATVELTLEAGDRRVSVRMRATPKGGIAAEIEASGFPVRGGKLESTHAPIEIGEGTLAVRVRADFEGDTVRASAHVAVEALRLSLGGGSDSRFAFLREVFVDFRGLTADLELTFDDGKIASFECRSDKGGDLTAAFRKALEKEIGKAKSQALAKIEDLTAGPLAEARKSVDAVLGEARGLKLEGVEDFDYPSDPAKAVAQLQAEVDSLAARRGQVGSSISAGSAEQTSSADATRAVLDGEVQRLGSVKSGLKAEIERLLKSMR